MNNTSNQKLMQVLENQIQKCWTLSCPYQMLLHLFHCLLTYTVNMYSVLNLYILKFIAGSPILRHHRPGTILYQNDRYDLLRSPWRFENWTLSDFMWTTVYRLRTLYIEYPVQKARVRYLIFKKTYLEKLFNMKPKLIRIKTKFLNIWAKSSHGYLPSKNPTQNNPKPL